MSLFNFKFPAPDKPISQHPWQRVIKDKHSNKVKYAHNSVKNPEYPKKEDKQTKQANEPDEPRMRFTIIGNRVTKEFTYCVNVVRGLHRYRQKKFDAPIIRGVTGLEWPSVWNDLKTRYGEFAYCLQSQVAVIMNDIFVGGEEELKELIGTKYVYHLCLDYGKEGVNQFAAYVRSSGRPCAYFHFSINDQEAGSMIFMLYSDVVPYTCDNFLRLCKQTKGGYGGTPVHRIVKDGWIQCGGFGLKGNDDLGCENFIVPHDRRGVLCMANDGRHKDCATQFFVLLQPAPWMMYKYVAFGQLIDGENTLKKIEEVPTFYESPTKTVTIYRAGILNLDCQDVTINKKAKEYIFGHIDDLIVIGELFYEALMEKVFAEVEKREREALLRSEEMEGEFAGEADTLKDSERFLRNKEDIEKQLGKSQGAVVPEPEQIDLEEIEYMYEYEGMPYQHETIGHTPSVAKPERPFYLPLTDVPYPDEVDSTFDLKRFLRGDYCHETDLCVEVRHEAKKTGVTYPSELLVCSESSEDASISSVDLESDEEREIKKYLSQNVDRVSFAGGTVKKISRGVAKFNLFGSLTSDVIITDEILRKVRTLSPESHKHEKKVSVSISVEPEDEEKVHHKIKRRQTGFVRPTEMERIRLIAKLNQQTEFEHEEDPDQDSDKFKDKKEEKKEDKKSVSMKIADGEEQSNQKQTQIKRRQTGFIRPTHMAQADIEESDDEDDEPANARKVRISQKLAASPTERQKQMRRPTGFVRTEYIDGNESEFEIHRPSVLQRLYDDVAIDDHENIPTLKDYKPKTELIPKMSNLLTYDNLLIRESMVDESKEKYFRHSTLIKEPYPENVLNLQHGKKAARKISSDYVKTIDQMERREQNSIRSIEFARSRPAMNVLEYQRKNSKYQEDLRNSFKHQVKTDRPEEDTATVGLRLPGDTPLYMDSTENTKQDETPLRIHMVRSKLSRISQPKYGRQ